MVEGVEQALVWARASHRFPKGANVFVGDATKAAQATKTYLDKASHASGKQRLDDQALFQNLHTAWLALHDFIKPVIDASALRIPRPLVEFLNEQLQQLSGLSGVRIIAGLTPQLNYFQHRHTTVRGMIREIRNVVGEDCPGFGKVGFVSLPFSQPTNLFTNCILYHEAGHFVFEELDLRNRILRKTTDLIRTHFPEMQELEAGQLTPTQHWFVRMVIQWFEELFADVFAAKLLGPAYTLACAGLIRTVAGFESANSRKFSQHHPANVMRFSEQLIALKKDGWPLDQDWWREIHTWSDFSTDTLVPPNFVPDSIGQRLVKVLFELRAEVHTLADSVLSECGNPRTIFQPVSAAIRTSLAHGIVPSTVVIDKKPVLPHPTAVINAAIFYWLDGAPELYSRIVGKTDDKAIQNRSDVETRLERWAMKAVDDWLVMKARDSDPFHKELSWPS